MSTLHAVTYNVFKELPADVAEAAVREALAWRPDVMALQEMHPIDRQPFLARLDRGSIWGVIQYPDSRGSRQRSQAVTVYRRATMRLLKSRLTEVHGRGIGTDCRYMLEAKFLHKPTGRKVWVNNVHLLPKIAPDGRLILTDTAKRGLAVEAFDTITRRVRAQGRFGVTVLTEGDFNVADEEDDGTEDGNLQARMARVHARSSFDVLGRQGMHPTHGRDWLDAIFLRAGDHIARFQRHQVHPAGASDHRALSAWIDMSRR